MLKNLHLKIINLNVDQRELRGKQFLTDKQPIWMEQT